MCELCFKCLKHPVGKIPPSLTHPYILQRKEEDKNGPATTARWMRKKQMLPVLLRQGNPFPSLNVKVGKLKQEHPQLSGQQIHKVD